ncbi:MAG: T9SS type A sorting domain-containing protein [Ignavibacteria bacterium]|nr:T9SS type A sorting domain-containing protein [Ignavibacteria bacterium]OIO23386.1 MAG: hypothetical protein AUJ54_01810 [Ignavibacteria bacterium CG1_02_37_35]
MLSKTTCPNSIEKSRYKWVKFVLLEYLRLIFYYKFTSINKHKSFLFFFIFSLIISNHYLKAQWKFANGPYEATLLNISIDPLNPNILYTVGEGVFRSTNRGEYWVAIEPDTVLRANLEPVIKADPKNAGVVYYGGHGALFKSYNYGDDWKVIGFEKRSVTSIEIDPINPDIIYVGLKNSSDDAIWKSTDGGKTWGKKTNGIPVSQFPFQDCRAIKINPMNNNSLIAAVYSEGIFKSIDGGNNWKFLLGVNTYDVEFLPWDTTTVIAAVAGGIYKSTDDGQTWVRILNTGANCIEIDNTTKEFYAGMNKSTDEGDTWISLNNPELPTSFSLAMTVDDIKIDPINNILYLATGAGIYKSFDKGINWIQAFDGLNDFYAYSLAFSSSNPTVMYTTGREGIHKSTNGGKSWKYIGGGAAENFITVDPTNPDIVYVAQMPILTTFWLWRTMDGGKTWEKKLTSLARFDFIAIDPINPSIIYSVYTDVSKSTIVKSYDKGETWEDLNTPIKPSDMIISKSNNSVIYIGSGEGVYKTIDGGITWNYLGLPANNHRILLSFAPENEKIIYASVYGQGVFKTTDGGVHWEIKNQGFTDTIAGAIIPDPKQIGRVFLNTLMGLYVSTNGGDEWKKFRPEDFPNLFYPLGIDTTGTGRIFAVRNNEPGVYTLDSIYSDPSYVEENSSPQNFILYQNYPNPFNMSTMIKFVIPSTTNVKLEIYDFLGNKIMTLINGYKSSGVYSFEWNGKNEKGEYVSSGLYFLRLLNANMVLSKKMIVIK